MALDVVALRAAGVGDLLTAVPALRAAADLGVDGLTLAAPQWLHPLGHLIPGVTHTVDVDGLRPRTSLHGKVVFNLHGCGPQSHQALLAGRPRDLVAFRSPQVWEFGPEWLETPEESERERHCRLLGWVGIDADPEWVRIDRPGVEPPVAHAVILHVGGSDPQRRWPVERFAQVARHLRGHRLVITGGPGDVVTAHATAEFAGLEPSAVLAGTTALDEFAALVAHADLVVTGDTGAAHLAHAYGTPSVVIFGPASAAQWGPPPGAPSRVLQAAGSEPRVDDVSVDEVLDAIEAQLEAR